MEPLTTALPTTATLIAPTPLTQETPGQSTSSSSSSFASSSATNADGETTSTSSSLITGTSTDGTAFNQAKTVTTINGVSTVSTDASPLMMPQSLPGTPFTVNLVVTGLPTIDVLAMAQAMNTTLLLVNSPLI
jgi:hypothetical protein